MRTIETVTLTIAIVGGACGLLGAVLGIINTCHQLGTTRVKLRVAPKLAKLDIEGGAWSLDRPSARSVEFMGDPATCCLSIEVVNLSAFPITIAEVGFGNPEGSAVEPKTASRAMFKKPRLSNGKELPLRLESRESVTAYGKRGELNLHCGPRAYVETDCGTVALGSTPITEALWRTANRKKQETT